MTLLPKIKLKAVVSFPATVLDGVGIDVVKENGNYQFDLAYDDFAPPVAGIADPANQNVLLWNSITNSYVLAPASLLGAGDSIPEAPNDGVQYGRQLLAWTPITSGSGNTPSDANPIMDGVAWHGIAAEYSRGDHVHPRDTSRADVVHVHIAADITDFSEAVDDRVGGLLVAGANITLSYNDAGNALTIASAGGGAGTPSDSSPVMDGVAAPGILTTYSRGDHVHPTDTSRAAVSHTHLASQVTDFSEAVDDRVGALLVAGTNVTLNYNDAGNALTINASGGGGVTTVYQTRSLAAAATIAVDSFLILHYETGYPAVTAPYKRGAGELSFIDAGGATFSLDTSGGQVSAQWWWMKADGVTDDHAAITAAKAFAAANKKTLYFPDGTYKHSATLTWALASDFKVVGGDNVTFLHSGTGVAHDFNGRTLGSPSEGVARCKFGGPNRFKLKGNPAGGTTEVVRVDNWHWSEMKIAPRDGAICFKGQMSGGAAAAVESVFDIYIAQHVGDTITVQAGYGLFLDQFAACTFINPTVEVCGVGGLFAIYVTNSNGNLFLGGTAESNANGGVYVSPTSSRNTFVNMHNEFNVAAADWHIDGHHNTLINCAGAGTADTLATAANIIGGDYNTLSGGDFWDLQINASADYTQVIGAKLTGGASVLLVDNSATTTFTGCEGVVDKSPPPPVSAVTLGTSVTSFGSGYQPIGVSRGRDGFIVLEGVMIAGAAIAGGATIATVSVGFRPTAKLVYTGWNLSTETPIGLSIDAAGLVVNRLAITSGHIIDIGSRPFRRS